MSQDMYKIVASLIFALVLAGCACKEWFKKHIDIDIDISYVDDDGSKSTLVDLDSFEEQIL